ncbi:MAG TPA: hypothetical protein PKU97_23560, partial [Kofleriaceae bacterium]|nr:hypothetical protein [Kofleriaceae bacterium]
MMVHTWLPTAVASALALGALTLASPARAAPDDPDRTLDAKDLTKYFEPYVPGVRSCYADHGKGKEVTGVLRLELIIQPDGKV